MTRARSWSVFRRLVTVVIALALAAFPVAALARGVQDEILAQTAQVRGLAPKQPVPLALVDPAQLRQELLGSFTSEEAVREIEISRKLLVLLGLISPDADLRGLLLDLYAENILGYYSNQDKKMYVVSGQTEFGPEEKITLAHEFTHALQDQYFDLTALHSVAEDDGDASLAVLALIEGDATLTMALYARRFLSPDELQQIQAGGGPSSLSRAPLVIRDEVLFPYSEGFTFVLQLWREGNFEAVNQALRDPPRSTEQVIHPEKYLARDQPIKVAVPDLAAALGGTWKQLRSDVLGELDLRILLEQYTDPVIAARGAEGWGGDRFVQLEDATGRGAVLISTVWDSEAEAGEFYNTYVESIGRRYGARARRVEDVPSKLLWATPGGSLLIQKWDRRVAIIVAPDESVLTTLQSAIAPAAQPTPTPSGPVPAPVQVPR